MKKALNISIANSVFYIEEDAFHRLEDYLAEIRRHFASYPDRDEIVADIEARIAERFRAGGTKVVTMEDVSSLIAVMGEASEFEDGAGDSSAAPEEPSDRKRLFRDPDSVMIAGVCSGIAAYLGVDTTLVRLFFLVTLFFGGTGIILYIALWIAMPEAKTPIEKLQMRGSRVTVESISELVKEKAEEVSHHMHEPARRKEYESFFERILGIAATAVRGIGRFFTRGVFPILGKIIGIGVAFAACAAIIALAIAFFSVLINYPSEAIDFPLGELIRGPIYYATIITGFIALVLPAIFGLFLGVSLVRSRNTFVPKMTLSLFSIWLVALIAVGVLLVRISAIHEEYVRTDPSYQIDSRAFATEEFPAGIEVSDGQRIELVQASTTSVVAEGRRRDLDKLDIRVENGVLRISRRDETNLCIFCWNSPTGITIAAPSFQNIELENGSRLSAEENLSLNELSLSLENGSSADFSLDVQSILVKLENGSRATLAGSAENLSADISNASTLYAEDFLTDAALIEAENGSRAELSVQNTLSVIASNGSRVSYEGSPVVEERLENGSRLESMTPETVEPLASSTEAEMAE